MIQHYLVGARVSWNILEKVKLGNAVHYVRKMNFGIVKDITKCGGLCLVLDDNGNKHELETSEVDPI